MAAAATLAVGSRPTEFSLAFLDGGCERRGLLSELWSVRFEKIAPVREFPSFRGQGNFPGLWWSTTTGAHVGYESWLERDRVMLLDFDPRVVSMSSQPFWLSWTVGGRTRRHAPDFFARMSDGTGVVIDVRADDRIKPDDAEAFTQTLTACESVGWGYLRVGAVDPVLAANVRWLAGYRHRRCFDGDRASLLRQVFGSARSVSDGVAAAGDRLVFLPVLFHLLWTGELVCDLAAAPLNSASMVTAAGAAG